LGFVSFRGWRRTGECIHIEAIETRVGAGIPGEELRSRHDGSPRAPTLGLGLGLGLRLGLGTATLPPTWGSSPSHRGGTARERRGTESSISLVGVSSPDRSQGQDPAAHRVSDWGQGPRLSSARSSGLMRGSPRCAIAGRATIRCQRGSDGNRVTCSLDPSHGQPTRSDGHATVAARTVAWATLAAARASPGTARRRPGRRMSDRRPSPGRSPVWRADPQPTYDAARSESDHEPTPERSPVWRGRPAHSRTAPHIPRTIPDPRMGEALFGGPTLGARTNADSPRRTPRVAAGLGWSFLITP
jgi:hypothetical protein